MSYAIIATLGPSSSTPDLWREMLAAGATAFRLNTSHLTLTGLERWLTRLDAFRSSFSTPLPLVLDLQGSKWRIGEISPLSLRAGETVRLVYGNTAARSGDLPVPHRDFFQAASRSDGEINLNDAKIRLRLKNAAPELVEAVVEQGGELSAHKGITYSGSAFRAETFNEKDRQIVAAYSGQAGVRFAVSYVRDGEEMARYRALVGREADLIAKIERGSAVDDALRIAYYCEEIWLCRGDLGAEMGLAGMARAASRFAALISALPIPAVLAGQVLEHLTAHSAPTRAEICNLYDALKAGYTGVVLSDETAVGQNPIEACRAAALFRI